jgi:hypothetical protein
MSTLLVSLSMSALLILSLGFSFQSSVFAQITSTNENNNFIKNNNFASSFQQVAATPPLITNISSKGIYKVELGFMTGVSIQSLPKHGFHTYIRFMNATAPPATSETIPNKAAQSGGTTMGVGTQYNVPGSIKRIVAIKSFDMTVYDSHGNVLWNKVNLRPSAGLTLEEVVFPTGTSGDITISIHNIESALHNAPTDSVDFAAKVA